MLKKIYWRAENLKTCNDTEEQLEIQKEKVEIFKYHCWVLLHILNLSGENYLYFRLVNWNLDYRPRLRSQNRKPS